MFGACTEQPNYCLITEYAPHGSLYDYLANRQYQPLNVSMFEYIFDELSYIP